MSLGIGIGIGVDRGGGGGTEAAIRALFANSEQGAWFDPSQLSTQYQDSLGTTPVTVVEQPVGLILDKRLGAVRSGSELITNGTFDTNTTGWTPTNFGVLSVSSSRMLVTNDATGTNYGGAVQSIATVSGKFYEVTVSFEKGTAVFGFLNVGTTSGNTEYGQHTSASTGTLRLIFKAIGATTYICVGNNLDASGTGFFDNISVKLLDGNHATQATSAARPVLSARVNLLTYSEQFDSGDWVKSDATVTANAVAAPDGATTADKLVEAATTNGHFIYQQPQLVNTSHEYSVAAKAGERSILYLWLQGPDRIGAFFNLGTGAVDYTEPGITSAISSLGDGWYRCKITRAAITAGTCYPGATLIASGTTQSYLGDGTSGLYLWGADLRQTAGTSVPVYQRIAAATDYDTAGFPRYLKPDGVDDSMTTAAIDFSAIDKMTVWAGVRKLSDATQGMIFELNSAAAAGTFFIVAPDTVAATDYRAQLQGASGTAKVVSAAAVAPITNVLAVQYDIAAAALSEVVLRLNGVAGGTASGNATTGNFGNYALHMFRRGGATLPFGGHFYGGIVRGAASTAAQLSVVERYLAAKSGVTL